MQADSSLSFSRHTSLVLIVLTSGLSVIGERLFTQIISLFNGSNVVPLEVAPDNADSAVIFANPLKLIGVKSNTRQLKDFWPQYRMNFQEAPPELRKAETVDNFKEQHLPRNPVHSRARQCGYLRFRTIQTIQTKQTRRSKCGNHEVCQTGIRK